MIDIEREREAERQAEGEAGSMQGARCRTRFWVSRITPSAEGSAKSLSHPGLPPRSLSSLPWKTKESDTSHIYLCLILNQCITSPRRIYKLQLSFELEGKAPNLGFV